MNQKSIIHMNSFDNEISFEFHRYVACTMLAVPKKVHERWQHSFLYILYINKPILKKEKSCFGATIVKHHTFSSFCFFLKVNLLLHRTRYIQIYFLQKSPYFHCDLYIRVSVDL